MLKRILLLSFFVTVLSATIVRAQGLTNLIIDPKLKGGVGAFPLGSAKVVFRDTLKGPVVRKRHVSGSRIDGGGLVSILIEGMVPDARKRYVVAITKNKEEFLQNFPKYQKLVKEGRRREAGGTLHILRGMQVATKVEKYSNNKKLGEIPQEVGTFFLEVPVIALKKSGGYLTILGYDPKAGDDIVDFGYGLENHIYGELQIDMSILEEGQHRFIMKVIKAKLTNEKLREQVYQEKSKREIEEMKRKMGYEIN